MAFMVSVFGFYSATETTQNQMTESAIFPTHAPPFILTSGIDGEGGCVPTVHHEKHHVRLFVCSFVLLFVCSFVHLFVCSFVRLFVCLFVRLFVFVRLYVCWFVCLFVCLFVRLFNLCFPFLHSQVE